MLGVFLLCGAFVAAEVSASVMASDVCIDPDNNILSLVRDLTGNRCDHTFDLLIFICYPSVILGIDSNLLLTHRPQHT